MTTPRQTCVVPDCGRPAHDALCAACTADLLEALRSVADGPTDAQGRRQPGLWGDLLAVYARQRRLGHPTGVIARPAGRPLPWDDAASDLIALLAGTLHHWACTLVELHPHLSLDRVGSTPGAAAWLARYPSFLAGHPAAADLYASLMSCVDRVRRRVDRPPARCYAGPCRAITPAGPCPEHLYAWPDRTMVRCPRCRTDHDVAQRRDWLLSEVEDCLATAAEISQAIPNLLGRPIKVSTIRNWAHTGRLAPRPPHPADPHGYARYRIGDVVALALSSQVRHRPPRTGVGVTAR